MIVRSGFQTYSVFYTRSTLSFANAFDEFGSYVGGAAIVYQMFQVANFLLCICFAHDSLPSDDSFTPRGRTSINAFRKSMEHAFQMTTKQKSPDERSQRPTTGGVDIGGDVV